MCVGVCVRPCVPVCVRACSVGERRQRASQLVRVKEQVLADCSSIDTSHRLNVIKHVCIIPHHDCITFD